MKVKELIHILNLVSPDLEIKLTLASYLDRVGSNTNDKIDDKIVEFSGFDLEVVESKEIICFYSEVAEIKEG